MCVLFFFYSHYIRDYEFIFRCDVFNLLLQPMVEGVPRDTSAFHSEVKFGDRICMYSTASTDTISSRQMAQMKKVGSIMYDLEKAFTRKESVILVIQRS